MFAFAPPRRSRRPSLTPMIDVVFLLLVFFMLASQFGKDTGLRLSGAGTGQTYAGPPRLVDILPDGIRLNGTPVTAGQLPKALAPLMQSPADTIVMRGEGGADVQRLLDVAGGLRAAGYETLVVVE